MRNENLSSVVRLASLAAVAALGLAGQSANADTVVFDSPPSAPVVNNDDLLFISTNFTIVASGYESTIIDPQDVFFGDSKSVTQSDKGLGIDGFWVDSPTEIDGKLINEFLSLQFDKTVSLSGFTLKNIDTDKSDGVRIYVGGSTSPAFTQTLLSSDPTVITLGTPLIGDRFVFTVAGGDSFFDPNGKSDYSLWSITATTVPLPPAALGGLAILGTMGAWRRLRRKSENLL